MVLNFNFDLFKVSSLIVRSHQIVTNIKCMFELILMEQSLDTKSFINFFTLFICFYIVMGTVPEPAGCTILACGSHFHTFVPGVLHALRLFWPNLKPTCTLGMMTSLLRKIHL